MALVFGNTKDLGGSVKAMCYAPAGFGKTVLCGTAPSPLIISAENGLLSLKAMSIPFIEVRTMADFRDAFRFASESEHAANFDTFCIDSASDIAESALRDMKKTEKDPRKAYGQLNDDMMEELVKWKHLKKSVYITCKQGSMTDGTTGVTQYAPSMPGKALPQEMPYWGDELFALRIIATEEGVPVRWIQTQPDVSYFAKDRSGCLDPYEPPNLTDIFNKILGAR